MHCPAAVEFDVSGFGIWLANSGSPDDRAKRRRTRRLPEKTDSASMGRLSADGCGEQKICRGRAPHNHKWLSLFKIGVVRVSNSWTDELLLLSVARSKAQPNVVWNQPTMGGF